MKKNDNKADEGKAWKAQVWVPIAVALIGFAGTLITALINRGAQPLPTVTPVVATPTDEIPAVTPVVATPTDEIPAVTPVVATPTDEIPTPSTLENELGSNIYFDNFDQGEKIWPIGDYSSDNVNGKTIIQDNAYRWEYEAIFSILAKVEPIGLPQVSDFELEANLALIEEDKGNADNGIPYGFMFRNLSNSYYDFLLRSDGSYQVRYWDGEAKKFEHLVNFTYSPLIDTQGINHIKIVAIGSNIKLFINNGIVSSLNHEDGPKSGKIFLAASTAKGQGVVIEMDDFQLKLLD